MYLHIQFIVLILWLLAVAFYSVYKIGYHTGHKKGYRSGKRKGSIMGYQTGRRKELEKTWYNNHRRKIKQMGKL